MSLAHFKVYARLGMASRPSRGTVTIDRGSSPALFTVRELRKHKTYTIPLDDVAGMVVRGMIMAEVRQKQALRRKKRR